LPWRNDRAFHGIFVRSFSASDGDGSGGFVDYLLLEVLPGRMAVVVSLTGTGH